MNREDIVKMAQECWPSGPKAMWAVDGELPHLELFANLVAAVEREACAKVCDERAMFQLAFDLAGQIRARGQA